MLRRFLVISDYPNTKFEIGEVLIQYYFETSTDGNYCYVTNPQSPLQGSSIKKEFAENMPHIFKELEWFEKRTIDEMPMYLKQTLDDGKTTYEKIISWDMKHLIGMIDEKYCCDLMLWKGKYQYQPATEEEYLKSQGVSTK